ncbi:alkaline phosphatase [Streptomyces sp. NPDC001985]|uniref:alkaline phosphatase n=1 Tax=Streptomyces sp. NPDC001985 TaxID=3154406 RepID=UPI00332139EF
MASDTFGGQTIARTANAAPAGGAARVIDAVREGKARNVILFVGDGTGEAELTAARNYLRGGDGRFASLDSFLLSGSCTNYSVLRGAPDKHNYVTDSAAAATAWSTGVKTYNGAIGVDAHGEPRQTIVEWAREQGLRTGIVTTEEVCDPTPAAMAAHVADRTCRGPDSMEACPVQDRANGGSGSIAEQLVRTRPDVLLGGGAGYFAQTVRDGHQPPRTVLDLARAAGYEVVTTADELSAAAGDGPVIGLFSEGPLARRLVGPIASPEGTAPTLCALNPDRPSTQPSLRHMTERALELLSRGREGDDQPGFFLMVESALIDNASHDADPCGMIGEVGELDDAVSAGLRYAREHPDTLVLVTADHCHTSQIVPVDVKSPGATVTLTAHDGEPMMINYGTNLVGLIQVHTGSQVRIAAEGPGAYQVLGLMDQTGLFSLIQRTLKVSTEHV